VEEWRIHDRERLPESVTAVSGAMLNQSRAMETYLDAGFKFCWSVVVALLLCSVLPTLAQTPAGLCLCSVLPTLNQTQAGL